MSGSNNAGSCAHHWLLSWPVAGYVAGVCKKCQATRTYPAYVEDRQTGLLTDSEVEDGRPAGRGRPAPVEGAPVNVI